METKKFQYLKEDIVENKEIILLWNDDDYFTGIDITRLSEDELDDLEQVIEENKERLKPFYKGFRKYLRNKEVIGDEEKI